MSRRRVPVLFLSLCVLLAAHGPAWATDKQAALFPFVLPWDDASKGPTDVSGWLDRPAGKDGPITVREGHLYEGPKRIRLWGVNLCFGANFPTHADAEKVAARMAKFGINCVRFHHMDMQTAPNGIWTADGKALDKGQLDKLDYLISQLKAHGIYADLNLHVSRSYPDMPKWQGMPDFFKGVDNFDAKMIDLQKAYARDLLTHQNPYTKTRYVEEPAVALVEINNENALGQDWWGGRLDLMPEPYATEMAKLWNDWLSARYPTQQALEGAWGAQAIPLGKEMLTNAGFEAGTRDWNLETHEGARATAKAAPEGPKGAPALVVHVDQAGKQGWHVQLGHAGLAFEKDKPYTITLLAKADAPRSVTLNAMQAHDPWRGLWSAELKLTTDWQPFHFTFQPSESDKAARITLTNLGAQTGSVSFAAVSLRPGGRTGLIEGERLGKLAPFAKGSFSSRTPAAQRDWIRFLWETESNYWTGMERFLKDDLGTKSLVVGTQMGWSPFTVQEKLDVIDSHSYWQHPHFPGRPWDMDNWTVQNISMAADPNGGTLPRLANSRVAGKPFICTEYNHSAPNTYAAETALLIASFAAMQDWDGVFLFAYSHRRDEWSTRKIPSFFDIDQHPGKMATLPAAAAMFLRGDVQPAGRAHVTYATMDEALEAARRAGPYLGADRFGAKATDALTEAVAVALRKEEATSAASPSSHASQFHWNPAQGKKYVTVDAPRSKAAVGFLCPGKVDLGGGVRVELGKSRQDWAALAITALDGPNLSAPGHILIAAVGDCENTAMGWKDDKHTSVGRDWGRAPSVVEGITAKVVLPVAATRVRAWPLDDRGQRKAPMKTSGDNAQAEVTLAPSHQTLWYELEIGPAR